MTNTPAPKPTLTPATTPRLRPLPPEMPYPSGSNILIRTPSPFPPTSKKD